MPEEQQKPTREVLEQATLEILEQATNLQLELSEDESKYDLQFIREKLALCSSFQERLSGMQMRLTRMSIDARRMAAQTKEQHRIREAELKLSSEYQDAARTEKTPWLVGQLSALHEEVESWASLLSLVSEVKGAVDSRVQLMRRLDSDLRLHSSLYEQGVREGAVPPPTRGPRNTGEIDLP